MALSYWEGGRRGGSRREGRGAVITGRVETVRSSRSRTCTQPQEVAKSPCRCLWGRAQMSGSRVLAATSPISNAKEELLPQRAQLCWWSRFTRISPSSPSVSAHSRAAYVNAAPSRNAWVDHNLLPPRGHGVGSVRFDWRADGFGECFLAEATIREQHVRKNKKLDWNDKTVMKVTQKPKQQSPDVWAGRQRRAHERTDPCKAPTSQLFKFD